MENAEVAKTLSELADLLELTGGNPYKVRAYRQAAQVIDTLPGPVSELWRRGDLTGVPAIGERIATRVGQLLERGTRPAGASATAIPTGSTSRRCSRWRVSKGSRSR